jgi:hypothetical protein
MVDDIEVDLDELQEKIFEQVCGHTGMPEIEARTRAKEVVAEAVAEARGWVPPDWALPENVTTDLIENHLVSIGELGQELGRVGDQIRHASTRAEKSAAYSDFFSTALRMAEAYKTSEYVRGYSMRIAEVLEQIETGRMCPVCAIIFKPKRVDQKYCTVRCRNVAKSRRYRERHSEAAAEVGV